MSDRYLYKAKRVDNKEWIKGYLYRISESLNPFIMLVNRNAESHEVDPSTICQYTGLHDCTKWGQLSKMEQDKFLSEWNIKENRKNQKEDWNGKKISENDIVKSANSGGIGIIKFGLYNSKHYGFYIKWVGNFDYREDIFYWCNNHFLTIAGNTLDNPELLEGATESKAAQCVGRWE